MPVFSAGLVVLYCLLDFVSSSFPDDIPCTNQSYCHEQLGEDSQCSFDSVQYLGTCVCDDYYYLQEEPSLSCAECPGIGDSCEEEQCCNEDYLVCHANTCMCIYNEYCWSVTDSERARFQRVAQCILAVALILTATILFILFWRACTRRSVVRRQLRHMSADSFLSLNSIQRLVLMQLQDRPPPYSPDCMPWKNMSEITEPPPSYIEAVGVPEQNQGEDNPVFVLAEIPMSGEGLVLTSAIIPHQTSSSLGNNTIVPQQNNAPPQSVALISNNISITTETNPQTLHAQSPTSSQSHLETQDSSVPTINTELHI